MRGMVPWCAVCGRGAVSIVDGTRSPTGLAFAVTRGLRAEEVNLSGQIRSSEVVRVPGLGCTVDNSQSLIDCVVPGVERAYIVRCSADAI